MEYLSISTIFMQTGRKSMINLWTLEGLRLAVGEEGSSTAAFTRANNCPLFDPTACIWFVSPWKVLPGRLEIGAEPGPC